MFYICFKSPERKESVVKERCHKARLAHENHDNSKGHEEHLLEGHQPKNVPGLKLHKADKHSGAPPRVLSQRVEQCEGVGGRVEQGEQKHWNQDKSDGSCVEKQHGEHQVMGCIL